MQNFNIRYECLDARDDYRAQLKKTGDPVIIGSWVDDNEGQEVHDDTFQVVSHDDMDFDDAPTPLCILDWFTRDE